MVVIIAAIDVEPASSDEDAQYSACLEVNLDEVEPLVVAPPHPANVRRLSEAEGIKMNAGYLGSCVSGRLEDIEVAARILSGRKVCDGFRLNVVPTSQLIMKQAASTGALATLIDAGAFVSSPSCDFCSGRLGAIAAGQKAVSTGTLNIPGRMGSYDAEIYLCSPATIAATAIEGKIADPRRYL